MLVWMALFGSSALPGLEIAACERLCVCRETRFTNAVRVKHAREFAPAVHHYQHDA
jgi:hypothetical protein